MSSHCQVLLSVCNHAVVEKGEMYVFFFSICYWCAGCAAIAVIRRMLKDVPEVVSKQFSGDNPLRHFFRGDQ